MDNEEVDIDDIWVFIKSSFHVFKDLTSFGA